MTRLVQFWLLLLAYSTFARTESLATSSASSQAISLSDSSTSATTALTTTSTGIPSPVAQSQNVQQNTPSNANETKEFNPFGVIGGNDNGDGGPKPASTDSNSPSKPSTTSGATSAATTKQVTESAKSATGSNTITSVIQTTTSQSSAETSAALSPERTASQPSAASTTNANLAKATQSGTSQSSESGSYSWKILGIGVLAFVGVVVIILCSAFSDSILRTIKSPFKKRDEEDEVLVPDWRRGSWRVGMDSPNGSGRYPEKDGSHFVVEDYNGYGDQEKSGMTMNGGPVSPFPRRSPSVRAGVARSPGLEGDSNARSVRGQAAGGYSLYPSPPPPAHTFTSVRGDGDSDPFADPHAMTHLDAYGGME